MDFLTQQVEFFITGTPSLIFCDVISLLFLLVQIQSKTSEITNNLLSLPADELSLQSVYLIFTSDLCSIKFSDKKMKFLICYEENINISLYVLYISS